MEFLIVGILVILGMGALLSEIKSDRIHKIFLVISCAVTAIGIAFVIFGLILAGWSGIVLLFWGIIAVLFGLILMIVGRLARYFRRNADKE
ncbi:MAG: hypothetical protein FWE12_06800 [Oscillospiraceae bacterium]|nr:hypothetical protein [Oscillospiraceae bacterium]